MMDVLYDPWVDVPVPPDFRTNTLKEQAKIKVLTWFEAPGHEIDERIKRRYADFTAGLSRMEGWRFTTECLLRSKWTSCSTWL